MGKPTVAVLLNGKAYSITELSAKVPGIVEGWYLGQETGNAIAGVLFGDVNPSGHLPVSIPRNVGQLPVYYYKTPAARRGYVFGDNSALYSRLGWDSATPRSGYGKPTLGQEHNRPDETTHVDCHGDKHWSRDRETQLCRCTYITLSAALFSPSSFFGVSSASIWNPALHDRDSSKLALSSFPS